MQGSSLLPEFTKHFYLSTIIINSKKFIFMKKIFTLISVAIAALSANAQVAQVDAEALGLGSDAITVAGGTKLCETDYAVVSIAFDDDFKMLDCKNNDYNTVMFDGVEALTSKGVQGSNNPKDGDGANPGISLVAPVGGGLAAVEALKDGYMYFVCKLSSNKNYYVFEEGSPVPFTLAMEIKDERFPDNKIAYTGKGEMQGEVEVITDNIWTNWPVRVALNDVEAATAGNGLGVIGFPIYAGCKYLVGAGGSKISFSAVYTADAACSTVSIKGTNSDAPKDEFVLIGGTDGIKNVTTNAVAAPHKVVTAKGIKIYNAGKAYNVAGQQL